jgi:hypothetical protein
MFKGSLCLLNQHLPQLVERDRLLEAVVNVLTSHVTSQHLGLKRRVDHEPRRFKSQPGMLLGEVSYVGSNLLHDLDPCFVRHLQVENQDAERLNRAARIRLPHCFVEPPLAGVNR